MLHSAARDVGAELLVLVPRESLLEGDAELKLVRALSYRLYDDALSAKTNIDEFIRAVNSRRTTVAGDLASFLSDHVGPGDVALLNTPMAPEVSGFADWYESLPNARRPAAVIHFVLPLQYYLAPDLAWQKQFATELYSVTIQRLSAVSSGRCLMLCNDRSLKKDLSTFGVDVRVHPVPTYVLPRAEIPEDQQLRIGLIGTVRPAKGLQLALKAFRQLQAEGAPYNWVIQTSPAKLDRETIEILSAPNVEHVDHVPTNSEYRMLLRRSSIVVLPYDPAGYSNYQSSSILYEALASGIPVICSETEFFTHELSALGFDELIFRPYSAEALAEKIRQVADDYPNYAGIFLNAMAQFDPNEEVKLLMEMLTKLSRRSDA